ncbi:hypothetical protein BJ742DRAFT_742477 [Cladochytrium replicatum]|nr:hypothetical protein BJ742DRAFT_742477 [Cladochytrium replicatum]
MPPKKKGGKKEKGGKGGGAGMDEESRRKLLEQMKDKAKEKVNIESKNAKLNQIKIQNRWREIMKLAKLRQLQSQVDILQQIHERQLDRKNAALSGLERDVTEAEEQYENALQAHCTNVDTLAELQMERLATLQRQFEADLAILQNEFESERTALKAKHVKEKFDLVGIMTRMEMDFGETEADARHEHSSFKDDVKNKNLEEKHALRIQLEGTVEDLWKHFQTALNQYNASTEERKRQFEELKLKDQKNAKEIEQQMKKLVKLQLCTSTNPNPSKETISHLKAKMSNNARDYDERNRALREEKEAIQVHFQELKHRMNEFRDREHRKLTDLTVLSNRVLRDLKEKVERAERIIKLAEMNRKLETEQEKVMPFAVVVSAEGDQRDGGSGEGEVESVVLNSSRPNSAKQVVQLPREYQAMEQFYKRFNRVMLDKLALEKQRGALREENEHLRSILKQYLDGISVSEEVMQRLNPLMVVNGNA